MTVQNSLAPLPCLPNVFTPVPHLQASRQSQGDFSQRYLKQGHPVIISGLLSPATDWSLDYLEDQIGEIEFPVRQYGKDRYQQSKKTWTSSGSGVEATTMSFAEYADQLREKTAHQNDAYLARCSLKETPLSHHSELEQAEAWFNLKAPATFMNLWVGPGSHVSCLHYDPMDGLLMQLHGQKKVLLFPPSQTYNLYPIPVYKQLRHGLKLRSVYSQVYPETPDFEEFPKFRQAIPHGQVAILNPGDILFLPAGWWHEVTSLGDDVVCSINRFWHVFPLSRALLSWNKWRAHLGSVFAAPHVIQNVISAFHGDNMAADLKTLIQRL